MDDSAAGMYQRFAELEAAGVSPIYFEWASAIARDAEALALIEGLPGMKRQPNLVFAAARMLGAPVGRYAPFREWIIGHWGAVRDVVRSHSTQTNEAGRCAVLLPVLAELDGPLALIEAGASGGLVLYPDRYSYRYDLEGETISLDPLDGPSAVLLPCAIEDGAAPSRLPDIAWRAGVDLDPVDVSDADSLAWLEALVWPEHDERRARLRAAAEVLVADPPQLVRGDILERTPELVAAAPQGARIVVFHSAVLAYLDQEHRREFAELMLGMPGVTWLSNESPRVVPEIAAKAESAISEETKGRMLLSVNGEPVALTGPHGQSYRAL